jgi:hypothetical protein
LYIRKHLHCTGSSANPLDNHRSAESEAMVKNCQNLFTKNFRQLPRHARFGSEEREDGAVNTTAKHVLPFLGDLYGTLEYFMACVNECDIGKQLLDRRLAEAVESEVALKCADAKLLGAVETVHAIQKQYDLQALNVQLGCRISKNAYNKERSLLGYESHEAAVKRAQSKGTK